MSGTLIKVIWHFSDCRLNSLNDIWVFSIKVKAATCNPRKKLWIFRSRSFSYLETQPSAPPPQHPPPLRTTWGIPDSVFQAWENVQQELWDVYDLAQRRDLSFSRQPALGAQSSRCQHTRVKHTTVPFPTCTSAMVWKVHPVCVERVLTIFCYPWTQ